jgi:RHH-type proline utilization regulon transcriptional repressor/proline dehydrogenase/delta 1-pyrroline-5-carboxylate dehydrogenase
VEVARDDAAVLGSLPDVDRVRVLAPLADATLAACHDAAVAVDRTPVTHDGRIELPCWLREQAISQTVHRHGRVADSSQDGGP